MTARTAKQSAVFKPAARLATIRRLEDRGGIRERLSAVAPYAAFALAYLEARRFPLADFYEIDQNGRRAYLFHGRGGPGTTTQLFGDAGLLKSLIALHPGPRTTLLTCEPEQVETALTSYHLWRPQTMVRLALDRDSFRRPEGLGNVRRLTSADAADLNRLYALEGEGIWYAGRQIQEGIYYGALNRGRLIAAAGTHIHSPSERVGVVGNVFTHPDFRGHGLATAVTGAVSAKLLERCDLVVLSVDPANRTARHVYERLGYREAGRLVESMASRRDSFSPLPLIRRLVARHRGDGRAEIVAL
jgi:RimJ/RimL family protein N-acetyltransferase